MKTCPTCQTVVFDDMAVCYGCLYKFEEEVEIDEDFLEVDEPVLPRVVLPPPSSASSSDWIVRLELRNEGRPRRVWSMELNPANLEALEASRPSA